MLYLVEKAGYAGAGILNAAQFAVVAEGHVAVPQRDAELLKKSREERIGAVVHNDKARVHRHIDVRIAVDYNGMGMPSDVVVFFVECDGVISVENIGGGETGNA